MRIVLNYLYQANTTAVVTTEKEFFLFRNYSCTTGTSAGSRTTVTTLAA